MDKRKVIAAYRRGLITIQECAQIIGVEGRQMPGLMSDPKLHAEYAPPRERRSVKYL